MSEKSKNKFTFKIIFSYLILGVLALASGYFIYTEINTYLSTETSGNNDAKLLKTGSFLTQLYEAESLSKLVLQKKTKKKFTAYSKKIDSISMEINTLKQLTNNYNQQALLDSVQFLLQQKVANNNELRILKVKNNASSSIDKAISEFSKIEASLGKITPEGLSPNIDELSPKAQSVIRDVAKYLNENVPANTNKLNNSQQVDSIINASKLLLNEAKQTDIKTQQFLAKKEMEINRSDLELSQQLRTIISAFEQEVLMNSLNDNHKKKSALKRSIRLAGFTVLLGLVIIGIFVFLINRDFWRVQAYRQKLENEKRFSESLLKSREQLISTVSHDLRTPLQTITGYTELIETTPLSPIQEQYITNIKSASNYITNLVNDLLDFSKLESDKLPIKNIPFTVSHLIQETAESIHAIQNHTLQLQEKKKINLHLDIAPELENNTLGDSFRLRQILTNIIGNAFKFTKEGHVKITATATNKNSKSIWVIIKVTDTGIGIPKEKQHLIFNEFTQLDNSSEKIFGGYGLGLTISKKLTKILKGQLTFESIVNQGSTFTLQIPLEIIKPRETTVPNYTKPNSKLQVLIIDDDTALLSMLSELAKSMGITTHTFTNFSQIKTNSIIEYDLVLTDIQMPKITGFDVLKRLQSGKYKHYKKQPIVAMTGRRDIASQDYTSEGFYHILQKPFSKNELVNMLKLLGFNNQKDIANKPLVKTSDKELSKSYNLDIIQSFLGANEDAIYEVVEIFLMDTRTNMQFIEEEISALNYTQINEIAHRMLPMFRQLEAKSAVPLLEDLELAKPTNMNKNKLINTYKKLKVRVHILISELENQLILI